MATINDSNPLSIHDLGDALALAQHTFGRVPEDSLVLIGFADGVSLGHLRVDLAPVVAMPEGSAEQLATWLTADESKAPAAMCLVLCDQAQRHDEEVLDRVSLAVATAFEARGIGVAVEHRLTDDQRWQSALAQTLDRHPELRAHRPMLPSDEAAAWAGQPQHEIEFPDKDSLAELLMTLLDLVVDAETPDWEAITELEARLDHAVCRSAADVKPYCILAKALVVHAQGRGSLAGALCSLVEGRDDDSFMLFTRRAIQDIHRFASVYATSHAAWLQRSAEEDQ